MASASPHERKAAVRQVLHAALRSLCVCKEIRRRMKMRIQAEVWIRTRL